MSCSCNESGDSTRTCRATPTTVTVARSERKATSNKKKNRIAAQMHLKTEVIPLGPAADSRGHQASLFLLFLFRCSFNKIIISAYKLQIKRVGPYVTTVECDF